MCYVWEGNIEKCQHCSETDFQTVLRMFWNIEPARRTHQLVARTTQHSFNQDAPSSSRQDARVDLHRDLAAGTLREHAHKLSYQVGPSSSRYDAGIEVPSQYKRQKLSGNQTSFPRHDASINGRQERNPDQHPSSIHNARNHGPPQSGQQAKHAVQAYLRHSARTAGTVPSGQQGSSQSQPSCLRLDARMDGAARRGQQAKDQDPSSSSIHDTLSDWTNGRGWKESHQDPPYSSRHHTTTDLTGEEEHQGPSQKLSQNHHRVEDMEVLTAGMNKLPPPCWGDERVILPLAQEQLREEDLYRRQEQEMDDIWGMYAKEREALAAVYNPEPEKHWTPVFEEPGIWERKTPLWDEVWAHSVLGGEAWMRNLLGENETWPQEPPEEADIWTREEGGMLSAAVLKRLLRVFTIQAVQEEERFQDSLKDEGPQISDESDTVSSILRNPEGDEVTLSFSEDFTSAGYPPLASQAQH